VPTERGFVAALGLSQLVSWGTLYYSFPLIGEAMINDMGWSRTDIYGAATLGLLAAALAAYPIGSLIDRGHGRKLMGGATIAASLALVAWSNIQTTTALYAVIITLGILQAALSYEPAFAVTVRQFGAQQSRSAITSITLWAGFSSTLFVPLLQFMLDGWGWRGALLALALINTVIAAPLYLWAIRPAKVENSRLPKVVSSERMSIRPVLCNPRFYLLSICFCMYMALFSGFTYHRYPLLIALASDTQSVVFAIALIGPAQVAARMLMLLFKKITIVRLGLSAGITFPLAIMMLKVPTTAFTIASACILYGAANGIFTIVRGMAVPELLSHQNYGRINGIMLVPMSLTRAAAPWIIAQYWTLSGSPDGTIHLMLVFAMLIPIMFAAAISANRTR